MTPDDFDDELRASLSLLQVYRLIALEPGGWRKDVLQTSFL